MLCTRFLLFLFLLFLHCFTYVVILFCCFCLLFLGFVIVFTGLLCLFLVVCCFDLVLFIVFIGLLLFLKCGLYRFLTFLWIQFVFVFDICVLFLYGLFNCLLVFVFVLVLYCVLFVLSFFIGFYCLFICF